MKMNRRNIEGVFALTPLQKGILYHTLASPGSEVYLEQMVLMLTGEVEVPLLLRAWQHVAETNVMLRTLFRWKGLEEPVQIVLKEYEIPFLEYELSARGEMEKEQCFAQLQIAERKQGVDLTEAPLRVTVVRLSETKVAMLSTYHHIILDGWSNAVLLEDLFEVYRLLADGQTPVVRPKTPYAEFVRWTQSQQVEEQSAYWQQYLAGYSAARRLGEQKYQRVEGVASCSLTLSSEETAMVDTFLQEYQTTPGALFYTGWGILYHKYTYSTDILTGTTVSGREAGLPGMERMVGLFINTLPLRLKMQPEQTILQMLRQVEIDLAARSSYTATPLAEILQQTGFAGPVENLLEANVVIENYPRPAMQDSRLQVEVRSIVEQANFDLTLLVVPGDLLEFQLHYNPGRFAHNAMERLLRHYFTILRCIISRPHERISRVEMLMEDERRILLAPPVDVTFDVGSRTIPAAFFRQAEATPEAVALIFGEEQYTYREAAEKVQQLAEALRAHGVQCNQLVALMVQRSPAMIVGMLGIMQAGGAYLPIDPEYPEERIRYLLTDSRTEILLTDSRTQAFFTDSRSEFLLTDSRNQTLPTDSRSKDLLTDSQTEILHTVSEADSLHIDSRPTLVCSEHPPTGEYFSGKVLVLQELLETPAQPCTEVMTGSESDDLAYVIYTSGSTGQPKGVMVEHRTVLNTLNWRRQYYNFGTGDRTLQLLSYAFDGSVTDIFTLLLSGAGVVLLEPARRVNLQYMADLIQRHQVTHLLAVPALYRTMLLEIADALTGLKAVTVAGEAFARDLVELHYATLPEVALVNEYGPTECSVCATVFTFAVNVAEVRIGKPIANVYCYVVDPYGQLAPVGSPGELWVGGAGVARGYLHRPDASADKFIADPFRAGRVYRTGDLVRMGADGNLAFVGRIDQQLKIRGYRVEPGEVEACLQHAPGVQFAAVSVCSTPEGSQELCAYFVGEAAESGELREYLRGHLPDYMVPRYMVRVAEIPLTAHGKVDYQALPALAEIATLRAPMTPPRNAVEEQIAEIWKRVLKVEQVGIEDNFFDLGGHSLKAMQILSLLQKHLDVEVNLASFFAAPTIAGLAGLIAKQEKQAFVQIERQPARPHYPLTFSQKRLWLLTQKEPERTDYHISGRFPLRGKVEIDLLLQALGALIARHESLRTAFQLAHGEPAQVIRSYVPAALDVTDFSTLPDAERRDAVVALAEAEAHRVFDLQTPPLFRARLCKLSPEQAELIFTMHHIISDGWSMEILQREFDSIYESLAADRVCDLPALPVQYGDFAVWQNNLLQDPVRSRRAREYWQQQLGDGMPELQLPQDFAETGEVGRESAAYRLMIDLELQKGLQNLALRCHTSLFTVLFTGFHLLLSGWSGQRDLVIGFPAAGRNHADLEHVIGFFVNTVVLRTRVDETEEARALLCRVRENLLLAMEYQHYPLELLCREKNIAYPVIRAFFNMLNLGELQEQPAEVAQGHISRVHDVKFDFTVYLQEYAQGIELSCHYLTGRFAPGTIEFLLHQYVSILAELVRDTTKPVREYLAMPRPTQTYLTADMDRFSNARIEQVFAAVVEAYPDKVAVKGTAQVLTYRELASQADVLATDLREVATGKAAPVVGLLFDHGGEMIVAMLAALQAGFTYVPLDATYPVERLVYMLQDSTAQFLVANEATRELARHLVSVGGKGKVDGQESSSTMGHSASEESGERSGNGAKKPGQSEVTDTEKISDKEFYIVGMTQNPLQSGVFAPVTRLEPAARAEQLLDPAPGGNGVGVIRPVGSQTSGDVTAFFRGAVSTPKHNPPLQLMDEDVLARRTPDQPAYILYTSGSTGRPKGVVQSHRNVLHYIRNYLERLQITADDRQTLFSAFGHDAAVMDIYSALLSGATLYPLNIKNQANIYDLQRWLEQERITIYHSVPTVYRYFMRTLRDARGLTHLRHIVLGGEAVLDHDVQVFQEHFGPGTVLSNLYGQSEASYNASLEICATDKRKRISLGEPVRDTRILVVGENDREVGAFETGEIVIAGEHVALGYWQNLERTAQVFGIHPTWGRYYRTGDLGQLFPDGRIEFTGRRDFQVKIRGYRVELGEIESHLLNAPGIREAVVVARQMPDATGLTQLVAYVIAAPYLGSAELRAYLRKHLPDYMLPARFIFLTKMPLTPTHKLDRRALPLLEREPLHPLLDRTNREKGLRYAVETVQEAREYREIPQSEDDVTSPGISGKPARGEDEVTPSGISRNRSQVELELTLPGICRNGSQAPDEVLPPEISGNPSKYADIVGFSKANRTSSQANDAVTVQRTAATLTEAQHLEQTLKKLWARVLSMPVEEIGLDDSLFDLGGNSFTVMELATQIYQVNGSEVQVTDLFRYPTIRGLAAKLAKTPQPADALAHASARGQTHTSTASDQEITSREPGDELATADHANSTVNTPPTPTIAVIGMAGRFPEAEDLAEFWANLASGRESIREFPALRKEELAKMLGDLPGQDYIRAGYLDQVTYFEPEIFNISREECKYIDPQHRLLLELTEEAILDAGYNPADLPVERVGVVVADNRVNYISRIAPSSPMAISNSASSANAGRIAYTYNFQGPVLTVGTACSSALAALHLACRCLQLGEADVVVCGGTELALLPESSREVGPGTIFSASQRVRAFDHTADGTARGEGGGVLVLKRLPDALRAGDHIRAVIKGSAVNSDGRRSNGMSAPSEAGQAAVLQRAWANAGIDPASISYIEAHGTGTRIGDPIEIAGIAEAYRDSGCLPQSIATGSVKTNIGHLNGAAGMASVLKTILALEHRMIPPTLNFAQPNPLIDFLHSPVYLANRLLPWAGPTPRRAGVTALGLTGTNAHLILEEAPAELLKAESAATAETSHTILLSARTAPSLQRMAQKLAIHLRNHPDLRLLDVAFTLNTGRRRWKHQLVFTAKSVEELADLLEAASTGNNNIAARIVNVDGIADEKSTEASIKIICPSVAHEGEGGGRSEFVGECGVNAALEEIVQGYLMSSGRRVSLPGYSFDRKSYYFQVPAGLVHPGGFADDKAPQSSRNRLESLDAPANHSNRAAGTFFTMLEEVYAGDSLNPAEKVSALDLDSIDLMQLVGKVKKAFQIDLPYRYFFEERTVAELCKIIEEMVCRDVQQPGTIPPAPGRDFYPVSSAQKRIYLLQEYASASTAYNLPGAYLVEGKLDLAHIENVLQRLIERHESLRTSFALHDGEIVQQIHQTVNFTLEFEQGECMETASLIRPFTLSEPPLFRVKLVQLAAEKYMLLFDLHHIISDGQSRDLLVRDLLRLYQGEVLPDLRIHYKDYAVWQQELFKSTSFASQEQYWLTTFAGELPVLNLPTDFPRPAVQNFAGATVQMNLSAELTRQLQTLAKEEGVTLYMLLLAAYSVLLSRSSSQDEVIVGSPVAGRHHADVSNIIGMFVNTLAMRNRLDGAETFRVLLARVRENCLRAYENQDYPLEMLLEKLPLHRDISRNPLFDTMLVLQNIPTSALHLPGLQMTQWEMTNPAAKMDLTLTVHEGEELHCQVEYATALFKRPTIERMLGHFQRICETVVTNPGIQLQAIPLLTPREVHLLDEWNRTEVAYPGEKTVLTLFCEQVRRTPDAPAVRFRGGELSYHQFYQAAETVARQLVQKGVQIEDPVAIMLHRSPAMLIGIYGILMAGGAYLPVDPAYPAERVEYMLRDSGARLVLTYENILPEMHLVERMDLSEEAWQNISNEQVGDDHKSRKEQDVENAAAQQKECPESSLRKNEEEWTHRSKPHNLAYIIYTSGSSGRPKGTLIEHHSVVNRLCWMQKCYPLAADDVILHKTPFTFDVSVWELFWWAISGAQVYLLLAGGEKEPQEILQSIEQQRVTVLHFVPSMLHVFLEYLEHCPGVGGLESLRRVFASGEALLPEQVARFNRYLHQPFGTTLHNLYGPTEATVDVTYYDCPPGVDEPLVPIGKPIDNTRIYIVNRDNQLQPVGIPGELCIAGVGLARGYLARPELTASRFVPDHFCAMTGCTEQATWPVGSRMGKSSI